MGDGGMMTKAPNIPVSCWNFYFNVDSINAAVKRVESGGGKIINTASIAGRQGYVEFAPYCCSKASVISLSSCSHS